MRTLQYVIRTHCNCTYAIACEFFLWRVQVGGYILAATGFIIALSMHKLDLDHSRVCFLHRVLPAWMKAELLYHFTCAHTPPPVASYGANVLILLLYLAHSFKHTSEMSTTVCRQSDFCKNDKGDHKTAFDSVHPVDSCEHHGCAAGSSHHTSSHNSSCVAHSSWVEAGESCDRVLTSDCMAIHIY